MMMGLDFLDDWRDRGVGLDHGRVHLVAESFPLFHLFGGRFFARLMDRMHGFLVGLSFGGEAGIGREGGIVGFFQFSFFGFGEEAQVMMMTRMRRVGWRRSRVWRRVILSF